MQGVHASFVFTIALCPLFDVEKLQPWLISAMSKFKKSVASSGFCRRPPGMITRYVHMAFEGVDARISRTL